MGKLIKTLAKSQEAAQTQAMAAQQGKQGLDPSKLDFCRVLYDYPLPQALRDGTFNPDVDLEVKKGDLVAVLDKSDPSGQMQGDSAWWRCRARDGRSGYLPATFLETIQRRPVAAQITDASSSRANTMPASMQDGRTGSMPSTRAHTLTSTATGARADTMSSLAGQVGAKVAPVVEGKGSAKGEVGQGQGERLQSMQKAWVNDR